MAPFAKQGGSQPKQSDSLKQTQTPGKQKLNRHEIARLASQRTQDGIATATDAKAGAPPDTSLAPTPPDMAQGRPRASTGPQLPYRSTTTTGTSDTNPGFPESDASEANRAPKRNTLNGDPLSIPRGTQNGESQLQPAPALAHATLSPLSLASTAPSAAMHANPPKESLPPIDTKVTEPTEEHAQHNENSGPISSNPATGAYRDLTTGAVVETDNDGNQAEPTTHPSIRAVDGGRKVSPAPDVTSPEIEMPGLDAAAQFLSQSTQGNRGGLSDGNEHERAQDEAGGAHDEDGQGENWQEVEPQVTGFAVASSKRNADFHALFPNVPEDDFLIENYGCAISRELLIQGRMYVSEAHVCFYSSIFGWVTSIVIPFSDIVSIEKRNTAYLIPNAILVKTLQSKYLFSSLVTRDLTYSMMVNIWRLSQPSAAARQHAVEADDASEDHTEDEHEKDDSGGNKGSKRERLRKHLAIVRHQAKKSENSSLDPRDSSTGTAKGATEDEEDSDSSDTDPDEEEKAAEHAPTQCDCEKNKLHLNSVILDETFPATPRRVFDLLFANEFMSKFLTDNQHLTELEIGEWKSENLGKDVTAVRDVAYVKPLNGPIGPKQTQCNIVEEQLHIDFDDFCTTMTTTRTPDVPNGSSFAVKTRTCFMWAEQSQARLLVTCSVEWSGRSMIRGIIDKASIEGQKQYYADLSAAIREHVETVEPSGSVHNTRASHASKSAAPDVGDSASSAKQVPVSPVSMSPSPSAPQARAASQEPRTIWEKAQDLVNTYAEALNIRPTVLLLGALIVLLLVSHVVLFIRGSPGVSRNPSNPHLLLTPSTSLRQQPLTMRHASLMIEEEVQHALDALAHSRRMTEALESEIHVLREAIQKQTQQMQERAQEPKKKSHTS